MSNVKHRKAMTRLRISAHRLAIETGRYTKTPIEKRVCTTCEGQIIEDEYHFLMKCKRYDGARDNMFKMVNAKCDGFKHLNEYDKFMFLLSAGCDIAETTDHYINECLPQSET